MRKIYLLLFLLVSFYFSNAQLKRTLSGAYPRFSLATGGGIVKMSNLAEDVDEQVSLGFKIDFLYNLKLVDRHHLTIGVGYEANRHIADGFFFKNSNGQFGFGITQPAWKQHELKMQYIDIPVLYKYRWLNTSAVSVGPFVGWLIDAKNEYKMLTSHFKGDVPVENKFRWGLRTEVEIMSFNNNARGGSNFSFGFQYQLSDYLKDAKSFKPFFGYVKFGIAIR